MEELRRKLIYILSGMVAIVIVVILMYLIRDVRYECISEDKTEFIATEIKVQENICWGKTNDGTYKKVEEYKEVPRFDLFAYLFISLLLYCVISWGFYRIIIVNF